MRCLLRFLLKHSGTLAICVGLLCLAAASGQAAVPWYADEMLAYTPESPGVRYPVTFDWSAVTAEITRVTPCAWTVKSISMTIIGPGGYSGSRQGAAGCGQPWIFVTGGVYSVELRLTYATENYVADPGNTTPLKTHMCIAPAEVNVRPSLFAVPISVLGHTLVPWNPIRVWGRVTSESPLRISDGRGEIQVNGMVALIGDFVAVTGNWDGTALTAEGVSVPDAPSGAGTPGLNVSNMYSTTPATCNLGHDVEYSFNWGDGTSSGWSTSTEAWHAWSALGPFNVTARARCQAHPDLTGTSSAWPIEVVDTAATSWECCDLGQFAALVQFFQGTGILSGGSLYSSMLDQISQLQSSVADNDLYAAAEQLQGLILTVEDNCIADQPPPTGILNTTGFPAGTALLNDLQCIGVALGLFVP